MKIETYLNLKEDDVIGISWVSGYDKYKVHLKYGGSVQITGQEIFKHDLTYNGKSAIPKLGDSEVCVCCYIDDEVAIYSVNGKCDRCGGLSFDTPENIEKDLGPCD